MNESNRTTPPLSLPAPKNQLTFHPWVLFGLFLVSNLLISYFPLAAYLKFWIGGLGLLVPVFMVCWDLVKTRPAAQEPFRDEFLPAAWLKWGWIFWGLALFLRFWKLSTLSVWPLEDEGLYGYISQRLMEGEPLKWFYLYIANPPASFCGLGFLFKVFGVSLRTLWLYPALLSLLALFLYGWAAKKMFSESFSFLFLLGMGVSFWPVYIGRFAVGGVLLFLWEGLSLVVLAFFIRKAPSKSGILEAAALGLAVGSGFYIFHIWVVVALALALALVLVAPLKNRNNIVSFCAFGSVAILVYAPLAWHLYQSMDTTFLRSLWTFHPNSNRYFFHFLLSNLSAFFWGPIRFDVFSYNPLWGGFLNPVLSSLVFLGGLDLVRFRSSLWVKYLLLSAFLLFLPQALSQGEEYMRAVQLIPLFLVLAVLGIRRLFFRSPGKGVPAGVLALVLLGLSLGFDTYHLFWVYPQRWTIVSNAGFTNKSLERQRAFHVFDDAKNEWGSGLILTNLTEDIHDQTLGLATWEFNAAENPKASLPRDPWVGILCNVHYREYMTRLFPNSRWQWLASDVFRENGGLMAGIIPVDSANLPILQRWVKAEKAMHLFAGDVLNDQLSPQARLLAPRLEAYYPLFKGDPFLESCYWEKQAQNAFLSHQYQDMVQPLQNAINLGVPAAHLYNRLGVVDLVIGDFAGAKWALEKAMRCPDNQTSASYLYTHYLEPHRQLRFP